MQIFSTAIFFLPWARGLGPEREVAHTRAPTVRQGSFFSMTLREASCLDTMADLHCIHLGRPPQVEIEIYIDFSGV